MKRRILMMVMGVFLVSNTGAQPVITDGDYWAIVGDAKNDPDTEIMNDGTTHYGRVTYTYCIAKFEVTNELYCEFLNNVATIEDTYGLYNTNMGDDVWDSGGITRSSNPGSYSYSVKDDRGNWPVNYVSWYDAIRFANWMHNGQGNGSTESGAYTITGSGPYWTVSKRNQDQDAQVWLPSENEWYKAAYYKGGGDNAGYWDYATQSDVLPIPEPPPGGNNSANHCGAVGAPTDVGAYTSSISAYGTFDQNGNMWEWNEALISNFYRGRRGDSWQYTCTDFMRASYRDVNCNPMTEDYDLGFRVARVPEPGTLLLFGLGGVALLRKRRV